MSKIHKVYIMYTGAYCKVGVTSRRVTDRIKEIQTSCPLPIYRYAEFGPLSRATAFHIETILKTQLAKHRTFGEWYKEFKGISKTVAYLLHNNSSDQFTIKRGNTEYDKFVDISIQLFQKIKKGRRDRDLTYLSQLLTNFNNEENLQDDTRFLAYSRDSLISILNTAIAETIQAYKKEEVA